jgi:hypothetical protein
MTAPIAALPQSLSRALQSAAGHAGVSFDFMVKTAARESGLDSGAKAKTSSAAGLFQFVEQTWLNMVSRHGASHGLAKEAGAVITGANGKLAVTDKAEYQRILNMRFDPKISAQMAGELTRENAAVLQRHLGRKPEEAELYIAHFMGAGQASALINAADVTPGARADSLFPKEAKANRPIFYDKDGASRSVAQVLRALKSAHTTPAPELAPAPSASQNFAAQSLTEPQLQTARAPSAAHAPYYRAFGAPILFLSPAIIQILSELSAPQSGTGTRTDEDNFQNRNNG